MKPEEFVSLAREAFAFLEREHSFTFSWEGGYIVRFDSPRVFVTVVYDATRSWELGVQVGLQVGIEYGIERPFELWTTLRAMGQAELPEAKSVIRSRASELPQNLERLAGLLRQYATNLLTGDIELFRLVGQQQDADNAAYALKTALSYARQNAEKAWKQRRYREVVRELESVEDHLSPAERKMLTIARKRVITDR